MNANDEQLDFEHRAAALKEIIAQLMKLPPATRRFVLLAACVFFDVEMPRDRSRW